MKALGDDLSRSTAATISGELRILLGTFSSIKFGVALYPKSKLPSKLEELGLVFSDDVSLLALENDEKYLLFSLSSCSASDVFLFSINSSLITVVFNSFTSLVSTSYVSSKLCFFTFSYGAAN